MERYHKILLAVAALLLFIVGGIQIYLSFFLDDQLEETAVTRFHEATDDEYELNIGDLDLWTFGRKLSVSDIEISPKGKSTGTDIRAIIDDINISGIGVLNYLISQNLNLNQIEFINPRIYVTSPKKSQDRGDSDPVAMSHKLSEAVLQELNSLSISDFSVRGISLVYNRADLPMDSLLSLKNSDIRITNIIVDSTSLKEDKILPAENLSMTFHDINHQTTNGLYELTANQLTFSSSDGQLKMDSLRLNPKYDKVEFTNQLKYEIDRIALQLGSINWEGIDSEQLNSAEGVFSEHIALRDADLEIYHDKRPPPPPDNRPPLPHEMLNNVPFPFSVDSLTITKSNIRYSERLAEAEKAGYIDFNDLSATFKSISNDEERWKKGDNPTLHAETNVMGKARLNTEFSFAVHDSSYQQQIKGNLEELDMKHLNDALIPLAFVQVDDGKILGLDFDMTLGQKQAQGQVRLRYEDLKISLLNKNTNTETIDKKIISFLANKFKLESDNNEEELRVGEVDFERDEEKSTFNYWWKSLLSGLKSSIGF